MSNQGKYGLLPRGLYGPRAIWSAAASEARRRFGFCFMPHPSPTRAPLAKAASRFACRRTPMSRQSSAFAFFLKLLLFENWRGSSLPPHI